MRFAIVMLSMVAALTGCRRTDPAVRVQEARTQIDALLEAVARYQRDTGSAPSEAQGLAALVTQPEGVSGWKGPYLEGKVPRDPWGRPFGYMPASGPIIASYGADGVPGGDGANTDVMSKMRATQ